MGHGFILLLLLCICLWQECWSDEQRKPIYQFAIALPNDPLLENEFEDDDRQGTFNFLTYTMGIIFDPCRGHDVNCCSGKYGEPEYIRKSNVVSAGWVWGIGRVTKKAYMCQQPCVGMWRLMNDTSELYKYDFDLIDADDTMVWAMVVTPREDLPNQLFRRPLDGSEPWIFTNGDFGSFTTSGRYALFALVRNTGEIKWCKKPCTGQWTSPTDVSGHPRENVVWGKPVWGANETDTTLIQIDSDKTHVWVLTREGRLFNRQFLLDDETSLRWDDVWIENSPYDQWVETTDGVHRFSKISVSTVANVVWGIDRDTNQPFACLSPCHKKGWLRMPLIATSANREIASMDLDREQVWATTVSGGVYQLPVDIADSSRRWKSVPASEDRSEPTIRAWNSVPDGGFSQITTSSSEKRLNLFNTYTVQEDPENCAFYTDEDSCRAKNEDRCSWDAQTVRCEKYIPERNSRLLKEYVTFNDPNCVLMEIIQNDGSVLLEGGYAVTKKNEKSELQMVRDPECVDQGVRKALPNIRPACWDFNDTVVANKPCFDSKGMKYENCVAIAIASTSYVVQCGGEASGDPECGTFLEIHKPGDEETISSTRIMAGNYLTGFQQMILPLEFDQFISETSRRLVCFGTYEVWWVLRTKRVRVVEKIKRFRVLEPLCDWNAEVGEYEIYATIPKHQSKH